MENNKLTLYVQRFRIYVAFPIMIIFWIIYLTAEIPRNIRRIEDYRVATHSEGVNAKVMNSVVAKGIVVGDIEFRLGNEERGNVCNVETVLGQESFKNDFAPGKTIKIIPREGCRNPLIATDIRSPIFDIVVLLVPSIMLLFAAMHILKTHRKGDLLTVR